MVDQPEQHEIISQETLDKIREYHWTQLEAGPLNKKTVERLHHISFHYRDGTTHAEMNLNEAVEILTEISRDLAVSTGLKMASEALYKIQYGKLLLMVEEHIQHHNKNITDATVKRETFEEISDRLFDSIGKRARRFDFMRVAKIPNVESYSFLGITRLVALANVLESIENPDPLQKLLSESGYEFKLENDDDTNEFVSLVSKAANRKLLADKKVIVDEQTLATITQQTKGGILPKSAVQKISSAVKRNNTIDSEVISSIQKTTKKSTSPDLSPSYNKLEETVLQLTDMMEEILDDGYIPDGYRGERTAYMFATLVSLQEEVFHAWSDSTKMKWAGFKEGLGR